MPGKFRNKYRNGSKRLKGYDYSLPGRYFITVCTQNRVKYFGCIIQLSELGNIAAQEWLKTPEIRSDMNLTLDEFVIMPDHFHAILIIGENSKIVMHPGGNVMQPGGNMASRFYNQYASRFYNQYASRFYNQYASRFTT